MDKLVMLLALVFATIFAQPLARRTGVAPAVLMTIFGCVLAFTPGVPVAQFDPNLLLPLLLPPLLFAAARRTSWRRIARHWDHISLRAVALIVVTTAAVAAVVHWVNPAVPIAAAVALGALVSPPDPVAIAALANRLGLPHRLVSVLESEGLCNDVTAMVIYSVAVQVVVTGRFSAWGAVGDLAWSVISAVAIGLLLGWLGGKVMRRLGEASWQVALGLALPFAAYGLARASGGSTVLAVLACTVLLTEATNAIDDSDYRLLGDSFWSITEMLMGGIAFGLIGLEIRVALTQIGSSDRPQLLGLSAAVIGVVVGVRLLWLSLTWGLLRGWHRRRDPGQPIHFRSVIVTWWSGQRGVATVALALMLPFAVSSGAPFPGRAEIVFAALAVVLFTLLVQAPTMPMIVRATRLSSDPTDAARHERRLWEQVRAAQLARLDQLASTNELSTDAYDLLRTGFDRPILGEGTHIGVGTNRTISLTPTVRRITDEVQAAGHRAALNARHESEIPPEVVERVVRRLDLRSTNSVVRPESVGILRDSTTAPQSRIGRVPPNRGSRPPAPSNVTVGPWPRAGRRR